MRTIANTQPNGFEILRLPEAVESRGSKVEKGDTAKMCATTSIEFGGYILALLVTRWGVAMPKDEEISGPATRGFGLASQVEWQSN